LFIIDHTDWWVNPAHHGFNLNELSSWWIG